MFLPVWPSIHQFITKVCMCNSSFMFSNYYLKNYIFLRQFDQTLFEGVITLIYLNLLQFDAMVLNSIGDRNFLQSDAIPSTDDRNSLLFDAITILYKLLTFHRWQKFFTIWCYNNSIQTTYLPPMTEILYHLML